MGILNQKMSSHETCANKAGKPIRYHADGTFRSKWRIIPMTFGAFIILIGLVTATIHIPCLLWYEPVESNESSFTIPLDSAGIRYMLEYAKDHPGDDFDQDGLTNAEETSHGTDPRDPDTDSDGISDYAEVHLYNTHPCEADTGLKDLTEKLLLEKNTSYNSPYKIHDVILWADTLEDRSSGTVIPTIRGYRFCNFHGWAQFPEQSYAYKVANGYHIPLTWRETENAWRIDDDSEIELYSSKLETAYILTVFGHTYRVVPGTLSDIFGFLLPKEHSFITFREVVLQDNSTSEINATVTEPYMVNIPSGNLSRYSEHTNQFSALTEVYSSILSGKSVTVSLQSPSNGEALLVAYGYTEFGDLLLADRNGNKNDSEGDPLILSIHENAAITVDQNGELRQREFFGFSGMGFDSTHGDKIHFIYQ